MQAILYDRHRFPPEIIRHAVWLYLRFTLSYRDVEELLAERGLDQLAVTLSPHDPYAHRFMACISEAHLFLGDYDVAVDWASPVSTRAQRSPLVWAHRPRSGACAPWPYHRGSERRQRGFPAPP